MATLDFDAGELLEQAQGNQSAIWYLAVRRARELEGSVDGWGTYVGENFAPSWDELGAEPSALEVARIAAMNFATTADMRPAELSGDDTGAELTLEGPDPEWVSEMGTTTDDLDRVNQLVFEAIAARRGLSLTCERDGNSYRMVFARQR